MKFGVSMFPTARSGNPGVLASYAERMGFEGFFVSDHTHAPVAKQDAPVGGPAPDYYGELFDPFVALASAASMTTTISLGTAVCLINQRHPINLAKQVASVDVISGGRMILGVGPGWHKAEMRHHGVEPAARYAQMRERVNVLRAIWTGDTAEFDGEFVSFARSRFGPRPVQRPHPPLYVGGWGPGALERVVSMGVGWMPTYWSVRDELLDRLDQLAELARANGAEAPPTVIVGATSQTPDTDEVPPFDELVAIADAGAKMWLIRLPTEYGPACEAIATAADVVQEFRAYCVSRTIPDRSRAPVEAPKAVAQGERVDL